MSTYVDLQIQLKSTIWSIYSLPLKLALDLSITQADTASQVQN